MKQIKQSLLLCLFTLIGMRLYAETIPNNQIRYKASEKLEETIDGNELHINSFNTSIVSHEFNDGEGIITFEGDVTTIGEWAFYDCYKLTNIEIPNSVISIGEYAFYGCTSLNDFKIPESVTAIGYHAFHSCTSISSLTIPKSVTSIGYGAFKDWPSLASIVVDPENPIYDSRDNCNAVIETATNTLVVGCTNTVIPNTVTKIGDCAFHTRSNLTSITIPESVISIGDEAFYDCSKLTNIEIPNSVISIGEYAFYYCTSLNDFKIPESVTAIGRHAFDYCRSLTNARIPKSVTSIGSGSFQSCDALTSIIVESDNPTYDSRDNCNAIIETATNTLISGCKNTIIPNTVISIGGEAFCGQATLTSLEIPNSVTSIGYHAFHSCTSISSLTIPKSVTSIGYGAFKDWPSLASIVVDPENPIYDSRDNCNAVIETATNTLVVGCTNTVIPNTVTQIGDCAFHTRSNLTSITIPNSVTSIGGEAFYGCTGLKSIKVAWKIPISITSGVSFPYENVTLYVPAGTKSLYEQADVWKDFETIIESIPNNQIRYKASEKLEETIDGKELHINSFNTSIVSHEFNDGEGIITFEDDVTSIGIHAFDGCRNLTGIYLPSTVIIIDQHAFSGCSNLTYIDLPNQLTSIEDRAFWGCSSLTSLAIPNSVNMINPGAFCGCSQLNSITVALDNPIYDSRDNCNAIIETATNTIVLGCNNTKIPTSVTSIGTEAFNSRWGSNLKIPDSVTTIGIHAFHSCTSAINLEIPKSVTSIGYGAFKDWPNLASIVVDPENPIYDSRDNCNAVIETATNTLVVGCTNTIIPNTVTKIGDCAFHTRSNLTSVTIPESVISIGDEAFYNCTGLKSIKVAWKIPISITSGVSFPYENVTLYVPAGTKSLYEQADVWKDFETIIEYIPNNQIRYKASEKLNEVTSDGDISGLHVNAFNTPILSHEFNDGEGLITFKDDVTTIGDYAFRLCSSLESVEMSNSITTIGKDAFSGCSGLTSITIPKSATSIGNQAFCNCSGLTSITIPNSIKSIGEYSFQLCYSLTSINIPNSVTSIGTRAFNGCEGLTSIKVNWQQPLPVQSNVFDGVDKSKCTLYVPKGTKQLYEKADIWKEFENIIEDGIPANEIWYTSSDDNVVTPYTDNFGATIISNTYSEGKGVIVFDDSVTNIGSYAFFDRSNLTTITIPNSVTSIGNGTFERCSSMTTIDIPNSVTSIGNVAFVYCFDLTSITIPKSATSIGNQAFLGCRSLTSITIPESVTSIGWGVLSDCSGLTSIIVDGNNTVYDSRDNCNAILETETNTLIAVCKNTIIPNKITSIGDHAFDRCNYWTSITIPNSVTSIGKNAFEYYSNLASISIPEDVTSIGNSAFADCSGLTSIIVDDNNTVYDSRENCNAIIETSTNTLIAGCKKTIIPNSVTSIDNNAFDRCSDLTSITIPNSIKSIGECSFQLCYSLTSINIPNSVTSIGTRAFNGCEGLTSIKVNWQQPLSVQPNVFDGVDKSECILYVPKGSKQLYESTAVWGSFENIVEFEAKSPAQPNTIFTEDITSTSGKQIVMPVYLSNENDVCNFQFQMYLPEGISVAEQGSRTKTYVINKGESRFDGLNHSVSSSLQNDGSILVLVSSTTNTNIWNDDEGGDDIRYSEPILYVMLDVADEMAEGSYKIQFKNATLSSYKNGETTRMVLNETESEILIVNRYAIHADCDDTKGSTSIDGVGYDSENESASAYEDVTVTAVPADGYTFWKWTENGEVVSTDNPYTFSLDSDRSLTAEFVLLGDVFEDELVDVADLTSVAGIILTATEPDDKTMLAADVYKDQNIDVADFTSIAGIILGGSSNAKSLGVRKDVMPEVVNMQFDVVMPENISISERLLAKTLRSMPISYSHDVSVKAQKDGSIRVLLTSFVNSPIENAKEGLDNFMVANDGTLADGTYGIILKNVVMAYSDMTVERFDSMNASITVDDATSINGMNGRTNSKEPVFGIDGRKAENISKGQIYIRKGKSFIHR